ncbi:hypothetical protein P175DRAFT_0418855, partial [Aspergillus ochraceoroseus IBT 24754]
FTRRLFLLPPPPNSPSASHSDLQSFLQYATRTNLPTASTLYQGTHYEYTVQKHLRRAGFNLYRIGGRDDAGIDLTGTWHAAGPVTSPAVRAVVQCKALKTKIGPSVVREVEGVAAAAAAAAAAQGRVVGVVVSPREATKGVRGALGRSTVPLVWMMMERDGRLRQVLWNARVQEELGMAGLGVEVRYSIARGEKEEEVALTWEGGEVLGMDEVEEQMQRLGEQWMERWEEDGVVGLSKEEMLDVVERLVPGTRPLML